MDTTTLIFGILLGFFLGFFIMRIFAFNEKKHDKKAILRGSRNSILGEVYEKILPALPNFPYAPKDMVFIGKGCDYLIFDGLSEGNLREILFLELKSGNAALNNNEKMIRDTLERKRVRYSEYRIQSTKNKD